MARFFCINGAQRYCPEKMRGLCKRRLKILGMFLIKFLFLELNFTTVQFILLLFVFLYVLSNYLFWISYELIYMGRSRIMGKIQQKFLSLLQRLQARTTRKINYCQLFIQITIEFNAAISKLW